MSLSSSTPVTGMRTLTVQLAVKFPSPVVTVITAVPGLCAVTRPSASTEATSGALLDHSTPFSEALSGETVAVSCSVPPTVSLSVSLSSSTPVAEVRTLMEHTFTPPTDISVLPLARAVTRPFSSTVATAGALLDHSGRVNVTPSSGSLPSNTPELRQALRSRVPPGSSVFAAAMGSVLYLTCSSPLPPIVPALFRLPPISMLRTASAPMLRLLSAPTVSPCSAGILRSPVSVNVAP